MARQIFVFRPTPVWLWLFIGRNNPVPIGSGLSINSGSPIFHRTEAMLGRLGSISLLDVVDLHHQFSQDKEAGKAPDAAAVCR
jgi:hypothetical protein